MSTTVTTTSAIPSIKIPWIFKVILIAVVGAVLYDSIFIRKDWFRGLIVLNLLTNYRVYLMFFYDIMSEDLYFLDQTQNYNVGIKSIRQGGINESFIDNERFVNPEISVPTHLGSRMISPPVAHQPPGVAQYVRHIDKIDYATDDQYELEEIEEIYKNRLITADFMDKSADYSNSNFPINAHY